MKCEFCEEEIRPREMKLWKTCCIASFLRQQFEKNIIKEIISFLKR